MLAGTLTLEGSSWIIIRSTTAVWRGSGWDQAFLATIERMVGVETCG